MTTILLSKCFLCEHFMDFHEEPTTEPGPPVRIFPQCEAFPEEIPEEVYTWNEPHETVRDDQEGEFIFEEVPGRRESNPGILDIIPMET